MTDPVVLIGTDTEDGSLKVVGLYETQERAQTAVHEKEAPSGLHYSVMTPAMNTARATRDIAYKVTAEEHHWLRRMVLAEREECAKIAADYAKRAWSAQFPSQEAAVAAEKIAKLISARG